MQDMANYLQSMRHQDEETKAQAVAQYSGLPYVELLGYSLALDILSIIPYETAAQYGAVVFSRTNNQVVIAITDPQNAASVQTVGNFIQTSGYQPSFAVCSPVSMQYALDVYKTALASNSSPNKANPQSNSASALSSLNEKLRTTSVTALVEVIFSSAMEMGASDIHVEPSEQGTRIRYRVDGVLQDIAVLSTDAYNPLNSRIKYLAHLKLDVKDIPQDGRFTISVAEQPLDIRISTLPAAYGEILDIRLLNSKTQLTADLNNLGIRPDAIALIGEAVNKPNGLILNTGPTGSGKTTTLYTILMRLNKPGVKIITLEDPIEYRLAGIDQVQIDHRQGYNFATALRASLRQDPNIIMVGEIRDKETSEIALQASMTGHLVLSTLHTNNAPSAFPRLIDMGVEPYLLAGSINLVIAQRLVRRLCQSCQGRGCNSCNGTGFKGRIAIIECLKPTPVIEQLIMNKAPVSEFLRVAKTEGMKTMEEDGMDKVAQGITTQEEIWRVTKE